MRTLGFITTAIVAVFVLVAIAVLLMSLPDIRRYFQIRKM